jgi:folate-binding protein YgfZ
MNEQWAETLEADGVQPAAAGPDSSTDVVAETSDEAQLVDLSSLSILEITGADAATFLQGQFCNDLGQVSVTRAQITGYCTPKGRLLALPTIVGFDQGFRLLVPIDVREAFVKRLSMFVMRSKVVIAERADWVCTGVLASTDGALGQAASRLGALPRSALDVATSETRQIIHWHDARWGAERARYVVLASIEDQSALWKACDQMAKTGRAVWRLGDISAGVPSVTTGVVDAFVPQMLNLQLTGGLSFTKGCYPGQEIVARMQYLGKLKRHMRRFRLPPDAKGQVAVPAAGDTLTTDEDADAGIVVDAILGADGQAELLAVVKVSANDVTLFSNDHPLVPLDLPYELPSLVQADVPTSAG